jgi:hypothetical protein
MTGGVAVLSGKGLLSRSGTPVVADGSSWLIEDQSQAGLGSILFVNVNERQDTKLTSLCRKVHALKCRDRERKSSLHVATAVPAQSSEMAEAEKDEVELKRH